MYRKWVLLIMSLCMAASIVDAAVGQYYSPYTPASPPTTHNYNPFGYLPGYAGQQLSQQYHQATGPQMSLNQLALRNAQQLTTESLQQPVNSPGAGRIGLGLGTSESGGKPFSGFSQGPTISPYLNLFRNDLSGNTGLNYSTLVQPLLQQEQVNRQQQREDMQLSRRLQSITAQPAFNPQGSKQEYPTGHQTVFQYYDHYYSNPRPHQKKRAQ